MIMNNKVEYVSLSIKVIKMI